MIAISQKNKIVISILLLVCLCFTVINFPRTFSLTETMRISEINALQSSLLDLQNQDGGFSDKVVPDLRKQLYDSYYAVKTLEQLGYDLDELKHTKEWIKTINIQKQILSQEDCVVDLILYIVGLYDLLDIELLPADERAIEKFLQNLQSEEGYFYGTIGDKDTDTTFLPYQNTDILTATHTICEIFNILKKSPSFMKSLKIFNNNVLQIIENENFDINQLEIYIVALKINALLTEIDSDYIPVQSNNKLIKEEYWEQLIDSDEMNGIFQLHFLYECSTVGKIGSEEQLDGILNKIVMLSNEHGGFYVTKNGAVNAQADYIGVKILNERGINLDETFKEVTVVSLLDKQYSTGYFSYERSASSIYNSYYAAKALALLPDAQKRAKNGLEDYANRQMDQLLAGNLSSTEDQIFTILLSQELDKEVPIEAIETSLKAIEKNWQVAAPEYNLMTLRYYIQALEKADMTIPSEWKEMILKQYLDCNEHKTALSGAEKILQVSYLYDIGNFLQKEKIDFQFDRQEMEKCIHQELDAVQATAWKNIIFLNELIGFYENHNIPLTFTNKLPSMENLYAMAEEDLNIMLSVELIYNLLQYNMHILPINTSDEIYEYMNQRNIENQQSFKSTHTVCIKEDSFSVETYKNLFRDLILIKNEHMQGSISEIETMEKELKELLRVDAQYFITEGVYQPFEEKSAYSDQNYGLWISGKWYSNRDVLALCNDKILGYNLTNSDHKILRFTQTVNFKMCGRTDAEIYGLDYKINKNTNNLIKISENYDNCDIVFLTEHVPIIIKPKAFGVIQNATYTVTMDYGYGGNYATMSVESIWKR